MLELEVLISELLAINGLSTTAISGGEVTALKHEVGDDTVENGSLVVKGLAALANTLLASAKSTEVLCGLGNSSTVQAEHNTFNSAVSNLNVEEDLAGHFGSLRQLLSSIYSTNSTKRPTYSIRKGHKSEEAQKNKLVHERREKMKGNVPLPHWLSFTIPPMPHVI